MERSSTRPVEEVAAHAETWTYAANTVTPAVTHAT
jgi:hypothetical protein